VQGRAHPSERGASYRERRTGSRRKKDPLDPTTSVLLASPGIGEGYTTLSFRPQPPAR
jgi:hypothetical protein